MNGKERKKSALSERVAAYYDAHPGSPSAVRCPICFSGRVLGPAWFGANEELIRRKLFHYARTAIAARFTYKRVVSRKGKFVRVMFRT
jgi:hypothetical protein